MSPFFFISGMFEHIKKRFPFPKEKWRKFLGSFERMEVPAKTLLLKEDEVSYNAYYIEKELSEHGIIMTGKM